MESTITQTAPSNTLSTRWAVPQAAGAQAARHNSGSVRSPGERWGDSTPEGCSRGPSDAPALTLESRMQIIHICKSWETH